MSSISLFELLMSLCYHRNHASSGANKFLHGKYPVSLFILFYANSRAIVIVLLFANNIRVHIFNVLVYFHVTPEDPIDVVTKKTVLAVKVFHV